MPSLKDMRVRIAATKATQKITKAMQMVAASKLRRAQAAAEAARPYAERMESVLANIASRTSGDGAPKLLAGTGNDKVHLLVVATGERGLAGAFNSAIVRLAREHISRLLAEGKEVKIMTVGRKGHEQLRRLYEKNIVDRTDLRGVRNVGYANASEIGEKVTAMFAKGEFDVATLFYSRFKSVIAQIPTAQQIIPPKFDAPASEGPSAAYEYEPEEEEILGDLLPRYVATQIFRALLENNASFYGAQMTAMDNATRNAGDMIRRQTIQYNRTRQAMITKELIEIISGAEAL
jgi:F-type H+-transporting ATPase subunit gamma